MPQISRELFVVLVGFPEDFRQAHLEELKDIAAQPLWINTLDSFSAKAPKPAAVLLNLDDPTNGSETKWSQLRAVFPDADLIAISRRDSAQLAMRCLREGFLDFLTEPVSPDELALCLLRCRQRREGNSRSFFPYGDFSRALAQISGCTSSASLRLRSLTFLQALLGSTHCAWLATPKKRLKILAAIPGDTAVRDLKELPTLGMEQRRKVSKSSTGNRKVLFRCHNNAGEKLVFWGIQRKLTRRKLDQALALIEHAELALLNLHRVEKLKRQTFVDDLTGLYNSRYLKFALDAATAPSENPEPFALLFIDVDRFKSVNDRHGHLVGSDFLSALGKIIKNAVRKLDLVFRYGGDEFVILLRNTGVQRAHEIAERLRIQIAARLFLIRGTRMNTTVSIGLAVYPEHARSRDKLVQLADQAMYEAKRTRNAVQTANTDAPRESSKILPDAELA